jgi:hypothetical protein
MGAIRTQEPIVARQAYFMALRAHWPEVLNSLRADVSPKYGPRWHEGGGERRIVHESWETLHSDPARKELLTAFQNWAGRFRIREDWIIQTALDTLQNYSDFTPTPLVRPEGNQDWFWLYMPAGQDPRFLPTFDANVWYPPKNGQMEVWHEFKCRMKSQFKKRLEEYRRMMESMYGARKDNSIRDAEWTARYQKGDAAFEIATGLTGYDPEQAVYRAVARFASIIGLKLRQNRKRHHTPKQSCGD